MLRQRTGVNEIARVWPDGQTVFEASEMVDMDGIGCWHCASAEKCLRKADQIAFELRRTHKSVTFLVACRVFARRLAISYTRFTCRFHGHQVQPGDTLELLR